MLLSFHLALLVFSTHKIGFYLVFLYVLLFLIKFNDFHQFMMNQSPSLAKIVALEEFQRDALVISCLSLFLELFGHILISVLSGMGYYIYVMNQKYIMMIVVICMVSEFSR